MTKVSLLLGAIRNRAVAVPLVVGALSLVSLIGIQSSAYAIDNCSPKNWCSPDPHYYVKFLSLACIVVTSDEASLREGWDFSKGDDEPEIVAEGDSVWESGSWGCYPGEAFTINKTVPLVGMDGNLSVLIEEDDGLFNRHDFIGDFDIFIYEADGKIHDRSLSGSGALYRIYYRVLVT